MLKINVNEMGEEARTSPKGKFSTARKHVSVILGREPDSMDLNERHPFDVEIYRVPPGKTNFPYHSHSAQWEYYQVLSGQGTVRHAEGKTPIVVGDAFIFKPGEPHQLINDSAADLVILIVADNPVGETCFYPDSGKWLVRSPERKLIRSEGLEYLDGEE